jgi:hypothetical protein
VPKQYQPNAAVGISLAFRKSHPNKLNNISAPGGKLDSGQGTIYPRYYMICKRCGEGSKLRPMG